MNMHSKLPDSDSPAAYPYRPLADEAPARIESGSGSRRRWLVPLLIAVGVLAVAVWGWTTFGDAKPAAVPPAQVPQVTVIVPGQIPVADAVTASGSIAARRDAAVGVQGEGGRVIAVLVDPGQSVVRGQVLARIDRAVQVQQSASLAAAIGSAEADAALAGSELRRAEALVSKGFISKADIDRKTATRDGARARVAVARAQFAESRARLDRLDVRAPAAGLVLARSVETGQVVSPGSGALFRIAEGGVLEMRALVAEQDIARLKTGLPASVVPTGSTIEYRGTIWLIDPVIDAVSRQGVVRIALAYAPGLRVGAFASARIAAGETVRPVLPQSAVQVDDKGSYVLVVGADNRVAHRAITVGSVSDQGIAVAAGLNGNERVVATAAAFLNPGEKVAPVLATAAASSAAR